MREFVTHLLRRDNSNLEIDLFNIWHFVYLFTIFAGAILLAILWKNKSAESKEKLLRTMAYLTIGLYILDFFCMPLSDSYNGISQDKLPFHICTLMGVFVPFVQFNKKFEPIKKAVVVLSVTSSLMWMCYPGSALGDIPPFCYKVFQTFMFHGFLFTWGFLYLAMDVIRLRWRTIWHEFVGVLVILVWAALGNAIYADQNWFFIESSIFPFLSDEVMPPVVVFCVCGSVFVVYCIYFGVRALFAHSNKHKEPLTV